jgi:hypothetical protein
LQFIPPAPCSPMAQHKCNANSVCIGQSIRKQMQWMDIIVIWASDYLAISVASWCKNSKDILAFAGLSWASPSLSVIGFCRMIQSYHAKLLTKLLYKGTF